MALPVQAGRGFSALSQNASHGHIKGFPDPQALPQVSETHTIHWFSELYLANIHICADSSGHYKVKGTSNKLSAAVTGG